MDTTQHNLYTLFEQLGLASDEASVETFLKNHRLYSQDIALHEASFWTPQQAGFLQEAWHDDSDWAEAVDELNARLRA